MNPFQKKILGLESEIKEAAQKYYTDGTSSLTDTEFDQKVDELRDIAPNSDVLTTGWGYDVNLDTTPGAKVKHKYGEAGSLDKCHNWKELGAAFQWKTLWASLKLDGISVVLYYNKGKLYQALTRGDGTTGIDITDKIIKRCIAPEILDRKFTGAVRGEILMPFQQFEEYKKAHPEAKNPRNTTAGLINAKEVSSDLNYLYIVVYSVVGCESISSEYNVNSTKSMLAWLDKYFALVAPYEKLPEMKSADFEATMERLRDNWYGVYPADGIVLTQSSIEFTSTKGMTYTAKAFKFPAESKVTRVLDVEWAMSKTHYLIPRVHVESVELSGTNVEYCTGFNAQYIRDNQIGTGAEVELMKSGEIIPAIVQVVKPGQLSMPTKCPDCGSVLEWNGVHLQCPNPECANAQRQDLSIWLESLAPVDGLKDAIKFKFIEDIWGKDVTVESMMACPPAAPKFDMKSWAMAGGQRANMALMFTNLYGWGSIKYTLEQAIRACNIPRFGEVTAAKLAQYPSLVQLFLRDDYITKACGDADVCAKLYEAIGVANTESLFRNVSKIRRLLLIQNRIAWKASQAASADARRVAITGKLSVSRAAFVAELKEHGFVVKDDVSKSTFALITDDPSSSSSKNKSATTYGVPKLTEAEFREKYLH